jgi:parallel beta-helix repeat protein
MSVTSRKIRLPGIPARLLFAITLTVALVVYGFAATAARASDDIAVVIETIRKAILDADKATDVESRIAAYDQARDQLVSLSVISDGGSKEARDAIAAFENDGITADVVTAGTLSAVLSTLSIKVEDPDVRVAKRMHIEELIDSLTRPELRISALSDYARQIAEDHDAAMALLQKGMEISATVVTEDEKNAALNNIAQASTFVEPKLVSALTDRAIGGMWPVRMRAYARYDIALRLLKDRKVGNKDIREAGFEAIDASVKAQLKKGDIDGALLWALAVDPEDSERRAEVINDVLGAALKANAINLLPILATSLADRSDQEDVILRIVKDRIDANRLIDAVSMTNVMGEGPALAEIVFFLASELKDRGLAKMAAEQYQRASTVANALTGDEKEAATIAAIRSATDLELFDDAGVFVAQLTDIRSASNALGNLAKAYADHGDMKSAEALLPKIAARKDREQALSGIGRAKAKSGDIDEAARIAETISDAGDKGRIQSEIARGWARKGKVEDAVALARSIQEPQFRVEALLRVAKEMSEKDNAKSAQDVVAQAISYAGALDNAKQRDARLLDIIDYLSKSDQIDLAKKLAETIDDEKIKAKAVGRIASRAALSGDVKSAIAYFNASPAAPDDAVKAEVMTAAAQHPAYVKLAALAVSEIVDPMLRVRAFRAIAETQLKGLDHLGLGLGKGEPSDYRDWLKRAGLTQPRPVEPSAALFSDGRMQLRITPPPEASYARYGYPDISKSAATTRGMVPSAVQGRVSLTLANLSPYLVKFVEDTQDGMSSLSYAARAQGALYPRIIVVQSGVYTLGSLASEIENVGGMKLVEREGDLVTLRAPLLIAEGASLVLSGEEAASYRLSADAGAFIAVAGKLYVQDTTVSSWDERSNQPLHSDKDKRGVFRPFIIAWSNSETYIGGSVLDSLGYAAPKSFGLSFSAGPNLVSETRDRPRRPTGIVVDNYFHNFEYGFYSYEADDISLIGNEYADNILYGIDPHDRSGRLLIALNTAHDTMMKHGIIISRSVDDSWKVGNVSFRNHGSGFMLDRSSIGNFIYGNVAFDNKQDGLTFFESSCNLAVNNAFFDNGRSGIRVRNSRDVGVHDNLITGNKLEAIGSYISDVSLVQTDHKRDMVMDPYVPMTTFAATGNLISDNGSGFKVSGVSGLTLARNEFQNQKGRLLNGDTRAFEGHMLRMNDQAGISIASSCRPRRPVTDLCTFRDAGFVGQNDALFFDDSASGDCTDKRGSVQFGAFHGKGDNT